MPTLWSANIHDVTFVWNVRRPDSSSGVAPRTMGHGMTESHRFQFRMILRVARDLGSLVDSVCRSRAQLAAENLFLRKQLAL